MSVLTKVVWREWFNEPAVEKMTEMGTLPLEEIELDVRLCDGEEVAALIAEKSDADGSELFRDGQTDIVIVEPAEFAGEYSVYADYTPTFTAYEKD